MPAIRTTRNSNKRKTPIATAAPVSTRTPRRCATCKRPRKGHPRSGCPFGKAVEPEDTEKAPEVSEKPPLSAMDLSAVDSDDTDLTAVDADDTDLTAVDADDTDLTAVDADDTGLAAVDADDADTDTEQPEEDTETHREAKVWVPLCGSGPMPPWIASVLSRVSALRAERFPHVDSLRIVATARGSSSQCSSDWDWDIDVEEEAPQPRTPSFVAV
ncbi:hypothetical protein C8F01DRAFT_1179557 [Mycena amicta]|nr:hypothetical protein C8F01DRAFT_1179557 [Mycena amicta]